MGQILKETERATGGDATKARLLNVTERPLFISELGLTKRESSEAQKLAEVPDDVFSEIRVV
jgi:hypothetical protein